MIPIDIVNKILLYISDINNTIIATQYNTITYKEYYVINFNSNFLWKIKSVLVMKRIYPMRGCEFSNKGNIELYKRGTEHYEKLLKLNKIK
jgi:hypothetical protein